MVDDSHQHAENAAAILKVAYCRDGADVAMQAAIHMISIAAALLTSESGPDLIAPYLADYRRGAGKSVLNDAINIFSLVAHRPFIYKGT